MKYTPNVARRLIAAALPMAAFAIHAADGPCGAVDGNITLPNFADVLSVFQLNGNTATMGNPVLTDDGPVLRLTDNLGQSGSAFLQCPIPLTDDAGFKASFSAFFSFRITTPQGIFDPDGQGADGIVFVVQTVSNNTGGAGGGIGYDGIQRSVGIEYDTWYNGELGDPNGNHLGIDLGGDIRSVQTLPIEKRMNDGDIWYSWVDYDGASQNLEVRLALSPTRPAEPSMFRNINLVDVLQQPNAFVGFTSGTGAAGGRHDILSFAFRNSYNPVTTITNPPPGTLVATVASPLVLNRQTGLFEQTVRVTAGEGGLPSSVRLYVDGLPEGVSLYNATGSTEGTPFVQSGVPVVAPPVDGGDEGGTTRRPSSAARGHASPADAGAASSSIDFLLEFLVPDRVAPTGLTYRPTTGSAISEGNPTGTLLQIDRSGLTGDGRLLVEFTSVPGKTYAIQYSTNLESWSTARPYVTAVVNRTQWLDDGAPKTTSKPGSPTTRFYRVVEIANP